MVNVFVLVLVGIFGGTVANDTPADPFPTAEACAAAANSFMEFAHSHGIMDPFSLACVPMVIHEPQRPDDKTSAEAK